MISQTAKYALRAMVAIAHNGGPALAKDIAEKTRIPRPYLSVILRRAVRKGLLKSTRGRGGGFLLARPAKDMTLLEIISPYDPVEADPVCPFGLPQCSDDKPCPLHSHWRPISSAFRMMLTRTTLDALKAEKPRTQAARSGRRQRARKVRRTR